MTQNRHDTAKHNCHLVGPPENFISDFIEAGLLVRFRRYLRRLLIISPRHPYYRFYITSLQKLRNEQKRHLVNHYFMIHPLSMFSFGFNIFMASLLFGTFIMAPIVTPTLPRALVQKLFLFKNIMHFILILVSFSTGYYDIKNNIVILHWHLAAIKYMRTYFLIDVAGILPALIRVLMDMEILNDENIFARLSLPVLVMIMYGRYFYCLEIFKQVSLSTELSAFAYKGIKLVAHLLVFLLLNMFVLYYLLVTELWFRYVSSDIQELRVNNAITAYIQHKALPITLKKNIWLYFNFKYQGHFYKESVIYKCTSFSLRREILIQATLKSTENFDFFRNLPEKVLEKLRSNMISEIFLPGDIIIKVGQKGTSMFFISAGTVKITSKENRIICYLRDGAHFGEVALLSNISRVANVIAETPCELFKLSRKCFLDVLDGYPKLMIEMSLMAQERISKTAHLPTSNENEEAQDIYSQFSADPGYYE